MKNKRQVRYKIIGEGKPLVFLHGNGEDSNIFINQIDYFKDKYQLILIDTVMHGMSNNSYAKYNFFELASDVSNILAKLNIKKASFIGFSDGANILYHLALKHGDLIDKGVAISGNINPFGFKLSVLLAIKIKEYFYFFFNRKKYYLYYLMGSNPRLKYSDLSKIDNNFLIIAGAKEEIKQSHTKKISKNIKNSKLILRSDFDHYAITKKPLIINEIISDYLK